MCSANILQIAWWNNSVHSRTMSSFSLWNSANPLWLRGYLSFWKIEDLDFYLWRKGELWKSQVWRHMGWRLWGWRCEGHKEWNVSPQGWWLRSKHNLWLKRTLHMPISFFADNHSYFADNHCIGCIICINPELKCMFWNATHSAPPSPLTNCL